MRKLLPFSVLFCLSWAACPSTAAGEGAWRARRAPVYEDVPEEDQAFFRYLEDDEGADLRTAAELRNEARLNQNYRGVPRLSRPVAQNVHDQLIVIIDENTSSSMQTKTDGKYESDIDTALESWFTFSGKNRGGDGKARLPLSASTRRKHKGDAKSQDTSTFRTELSGTVLYVYPNGHLAVEARKTQTVNNDTRTIVFTGVVDPRNLSHENKINARDVSDVAIQLLGKGDIANDNRRGWITRLFDRFKPL